MNYSEAVQYLYRLGQFGLKLGLENTLRLAARAGNPHQTLRFIHVAGTNGKGSTCAFLESICRATGLKTGLFTSPHLVSFRERIQIDRVLISEEDVARLVEGLARREAAPSATFFEAVTVIALQYFAEQKCDIVIWETGLGGRLDATNIVGPLVSVITNVQLDHQQWLGQTLPEIAFEKAGIIKPGIPIVTAAEAPALGVITEIAAQRRSPLTMAAPLDGYELGLAGEHQRLNAGVAVAALRAISDCLPIPEDALRLGLRQANWPGRLQRIRRSSGQIVLIDGAHNPAGAETFARALAGETAQAALILGMFADKDYAGICRALAPLASRIYLTHVASQRSADPRLLADICRQANPGASVSVCDDIAGALAATEGEPFVALAGSLHFVGEAMDSLGLAETASERELNEYLTPSAAVGSDGGQPLRNPERKGVIRAISFDVGGTLVAPFPSVGHVYAEVAARHGVHVLPEELNRRFATVWKRKKDFRHSLSDWSNLVDETFAGLANLPPSQTFFPELYDAFLAPAAWRVFDDVLPTLRALHERGFKMAAVSNWDSRLRPLLQGLELDPFFDAIIVSVEVGRAKPAPEMFRAAAEKLAVPAESILHVGDSPHEDVTGARAAGFQAVLLRREEASASPNQISSLAEILDLVGL